MSADCVLAADVAGPALTLARFAPDPTGLRLEAARTLVIDQPAALAAAAGAGLRALAGGRPILGLGLSANGAMDPAGRRMVAGPPNLAPLKDAAFPAQLAAELGGPVRLVNRAQAALIGAAVRGQVSGSGTLGLLIIDFECGVAIWKNGRLWQPNRRPPALGELQTPAGAYDQLLNIAGLTGADQPPPARRAEDVPARRETYLAHLAQCVANLARLYFIDTVLIAGRLVAAAAAAGVDLSNAIQARLPPATESFTPPRVQALAEGDTAALLGAAAVAEGEACARPARFRRAYKDLPTEAAAEVGLRLEACSPAELIALCLENENAVAARWNSQAAALTACAERISQAWQQGGRLIYVGCGTSGRLAALDAVELNCTFGLPREQAVALVSGGLAEAGFSIEEEFAEDASAVPELLLLNPRPGDVVLGVSASGAAYYVRSALALAKRRGAWTVLLSVAPPADATGFCDAHIALDTGPELVTGSTRMKAGTAAKKVLNALSTTAMILCGKVAGTYMIDVACVNAKLVERAQGILSALYGLDHQEARRLLAAHNLSLSAVVQALAKRPL